MDYKEYLLIPWPESQDFMDTEWFYEEAVAHPTISGSYFIPTEILLIEQNPFPSAPIDLLKLFNYNETARV